MQFSKMHGLSNDFMVIDAITQNVSLSQRLIRKLSDRHIGIGFDQLLIVEPPFDPELDFHYRIFNANGGEVTQCGNGACCFARFVHMKSLTKKRNIHISTINRRMSLRIIKYELVCVNMGEPSFEPSSIPFYAKEAKHTYVICASETAILCSVVSMGNPHCVIKVDNIETVSVKTLGSIIENHECFPEKTNVSFMQIIKRERIRLRVYERGVGETKACGSGACAAVAVGIIQGLLTEKVCVEQAGGQLNISWKGPGHMMYMIGSATHIYDGYICL